MQQNGFSSQFFCRRLAVPSAGYISSRLEPQPTSGITRSTGDSLESFTVARSVNAPGNPQGKKPVEMRRVGDAAWRWFESQSKAVVAFGVSHSDVSYLIRDPSKATDHARENFEARPAPSRKRERPTKRGAPPKSVEGAYQKQNGKWVDHAKFPGREFDDLDAYRVAKKQRAARRAAWSAQAY